MEVAVKPGSNEIVDSNSNYDVNVADKSPHGYKVPPVEASQRCICSPLSSRARSSEPNIEMKDKFVPRGLVARSTSRRYQPNLSDR